MRPPSLTLSLLFTLQLGCAPDPDPPVVESRRVVLSEAVPTVAILEFTTGWDADEAFVEFGLERGFGHRAPAERPAAWRR